MRRLAQSLPPRHLWSRGDIGQGVPRARLEPVLPGMWNALILQAPKIMLAYSKLFVSSLVLEILGASCVSGTVPGPGESA